MSARNLVPAAFAACLLLPTTPIAAQLLPNLRVTGVPVIPSTPKGGQVFAAGIRIANTSLVFAAAASRTGFYLSTAPLPLPADILLGAFATPSIARNDSAVVGGNVRIPVGITPGRYWFYAMADDQNAVVELDELDNFGHTNVVGYPIAGVVDLRISSIGGPPSITPGGAVSIPITIRNDGGIDAPSTATGVMLSTDAVITSSDTLAGWLSTPVIGPGQSITLPWNGRPPLCDDFYRTGSQTWIGAIADLYENAAEHDENNNVASRSATLTVNPPIGEYLEWRATAEATTPSTTTQLRLLMSEGTRSDLGITAAQFPGYRYLLLWSGSPTFTFDGYTSLSLQLVNSPVFVAWFGTVDARGHALAKFVLPRTTSTIRNVPVYTHHAYFTPTLQFAGFGATPVETLLYP